MRVRLSIAILSLVLFGRCGGEPSPAAVPAPSPWTTQSLGTDADFRDVFFLDDQRGWLVGGGHDIKGGIIGSTTDGGLTWEFQSGVARPSPRAHLFHLNAVRFLDEQTGVIAADGGIILNTVDGGRHWHRVHGPGGVSAHLYDLHFVDRSHGWVVGDRRLLRTTDGGRSWRRSNANDDESGFSARAIHFRNWLVGWAVGRHGTIFHTTDGGETWIRLHEPGGNRVVNSLFFADGDHGWVVGERGTIRHTADGGYSWRLQSANTGAYLSDVHFADSLRGWVVGFRKRDGISVVLHTEDGGTNWAEQKTVRGQDLRALFFDRAGRGWAVGDRVRPVAQTLLRYNPGR